MTGHEWLARALRAEQEVRAELARLRAEGREETARRLERAAAPLLEILAWHPVEAMADRPVARIEQKLA